MKITRENCEAYLMHIIAQLLRAGVVTVSILLSNPSPRKLLCQALYAWGHFIGCSQRTVANIARDIGMPHNDVVSDFVNHLFSRGTKEEKPYPRLAELLRVAHGDGPEAAVKYLVRVAQNRARDLARRHAVRQGRTGYIHGFNADDEYGVIDAGEARDERTAAFENDTLRQCAWMKFFSRMGEDFLSDTVILADAMGIPHKVMAQLFFAGRQAELVREISIRLKDCLPAGADADLTRLMDQAQAYALPAHLKADFDKLLALLYRKSNGAARQKLRLRLAACGI